MGSALVVLVLVFSSASVAGVESATAVPVASTSGTGRRPSLDAAYALLLERAGAARSRFSVYEDADSGANHGFPSGFFGAIGKIGLDAACVDDPTAVTGCTTDPARLDRTRGNVLRVSFGPLAPGEFAGVNIEEPEGWGVSRRGVGYDVRGATAVLFDARSPSPGGARVRFGVGDRTTPFMTVPQSATYSPMSVNLASLGLGEADLADLHVLFTVVTNAANAPGGATVLLDNIRFDPAPSRQADVLSLPLSTQTFGVVPRQTEAPGRVPIPPDQVNRNIAAIYEAALTLRALLDRGQPADLEQAGALADAFSYAVRNDNAGLPLPAAPDGATGLHSAYRSGELPLLNDQAPGAAQAGQPQFAGFSADASLCGPSRYCLVLDGATGGNVSFALIALLDAYERFGTVRYLEDARTLGRWITGLLTDTTGTGYGGYYLGYPDEGEPKTLITGKSVENNADIATAFTMLADNELRLGDTAAAATWTARADIAGDFVLAMFDPDVGRFNAGTVPAGTDPGPGIDPSGPQRGQDIINVTDFLDANTFTTLALAHLPRYRDVIDWRRPIRWSLAQAKTVIAAGSAYEGFNLLPVPTAGPDGIAWEFTGQMVAAMQDVARLYNDTSFDTSITRYLDQIAMAQTAAPFTDGRGLAASTMQAGDLLPPAEQCLSTPFQCIPERVGLASTTWAIFASTGRNPLAPLGPAPEAPVFTGASTPSPATVGTPYSYTFTATGNPAPSFTLNSGTLPAGLTLTSAGVLSGIPTTPGTSTFTVRAANGVSPDAITGPLPITVVAAPEGSTFAPLSPFRVWDSRVGPGPAGRIGAGQTRNVTVTNIGGVPATGATAVVLNVTAVNPSAGTYVTAWPAGESRPLASNLNVPPGDTRPNLVIVKVGAGGQVSFYNDAGTVDLIADVAGWYGPDAGQRYTPVSPARVWDSRSGPGPVGRIGAGQTRDVTVTDIGGVPSTGVTAVVLNVTAVNPTASTYVTAWSTGESRPLASNLNVPPGDTRPNLVIVKVGAGGQVSFYNDAGTTDLIADVAGYFGATGSSLTSVSPSRVWDSRSGPGPVGRIGAGQTRNVTVTNIGGVPASGVTAVVLNVTAVNPTAGTYVTAWPTGETRPLASNLNVPPGDTRPNLVIVKIGAGGQVSFYNDAGSVDLIADVAGWYGPTGL